MKKLMTILILTVAFLAISCSKGKLEEKGFQVSSSSENTDEDKPDGLNSDSLKFDTRPSNVLLTGIAKVRLTTIYKVNVNKRNNSTFIGSNSFYNRYDNSEEETNFHTNIMPGIEAVYGYNLVNVSHYDIATKKQKNFFDKPVLIKTLYYPTHSKDSLNGRPIKRDYFMVSVYNEDTNKDGFINLKDLRKFYLFNINGEKQGAIIPENYSILKSEYDPDNDFMYVFAQLDVNKNGEIDANEPTHIFWIDLKYPTNVARQF